MFDQPFKLSLVDTRGVMWALTRDAPGREGLWASKGLDLRAAVQHGSRATTTQVGETFTGWAADKMEGSLEVAVVSTSTESLWEVWQQFHAGLNPTIPAKLVAGTHNGFELSTEVFIPSFQVPDKSPATPGLTRVDTSLELVSMLGCWVTRPKVLPTGPQQLRNRGSFPLWPKVLWRGESEVRAPGGVTVKLPDTRGKAALLDTDPAVAGKIVVDGVVDRLLWIGMRGQYFPTPVAPGELQTWEVRGGGRLIVQEKYSTMWGVGL